MQKDILIHHILHRLPIHDVVTLWSCNHWVRECCRMYLRNNIRFVCDLMNCIKPPKGLQIHYHWVYDINTHPCIYAEVESIDITIVLNGSTSISIDFMFPCLHLLGIRVEGPSDLSCHFSMPQSLKTFTIHPSSQFQLEVSGGSIREFHVHGSFVLQALPILECASQTIESWVFHNPWFHTPIDWPDHLVLPQLHTLHVLNDQVVASSDYRMRFPALRNVRVPKYHWLPWVYRQCRPDYIHSFGVLGQDLFFHLNWTSTAHETFTPISDHVEVYDGPMIIHLPAVQELMINHQLMQCAQSWSILPFAIDPTQLLSLHFESSRIRPLPLHYVVPFILTQTRKQSFECISVSDKTMHPIDASILSNGYHYNELSIIPCHYKDIYFFDSLLRQVSHKLHLILDFDVLLRDVSYLAKAWAHISILMIQTTIVWWIQGSESHKKTNETICIRRGLIDVPWDLHDVANVCVLCREDVYSAPKVLSILHHLIL